MRWLAFLDRLRRPSVAEQLRAFDAELERNLASRKADRAARQERSRRGASTKLMQAIDRDALLNTRRNRTAPIQIVGGTNQEPSDGASLSIRSINQEACVAVPASELPLWRSAAA